MKEPVVKINFVDFWQTFNKTDNFFYNLLSTKYSVELSENPDFLFYSCYGDEYLKYNCKRIFYASENRRPDFLRCDYAISFDFIKRKNHFRLPLYHLYIDGHGYYENLTSKLTTEEAIAIWKQKSKFCCMLISNPNAKERIDFFNALNRFRVVDSAGRYLNNIGYTVDNKMEFIKDYKFVIAFENSSYDGYTTEKILEPLVANCIPIYWGNTLIGKDFNEACFLNLHSYSNCETLINKLIEIDNNDEIAIAMIAQKKISEQAKDHLIVVEQVLYFLENIINKNNNLPVAKNKLITALVFTRSLLTKFENKFFGRKKLSVYA